MSDIAAIELDGVRKKLGRFYLGPLDLKIPRGVVLALIGENGAGKTTTLDLLIGLGRPDAGEIRVFGFCHPRDAVAIKARTAYVTPDLNFAAWKTVGKTLDFLGGIYSDWNTQRCERLLQDFRLSRLDRLDTYSLGERMKFGLVTALARDADLFLLDEPTNGLDVTAQRILADEVGMLRQSEQRTIVISSHHVTYVERLADYVAILHNGDLLVAGQLDKVLQQYVCVDIALDENTAIPKVTGLKLLTRTATRARCLFDKATAMRADLEVRGYQIITESAMSLEELHSALIETYR